MVKRHERAQQDKEFLSAQIVAAVINYSMAHPKEPVKPSQFMPSQWGRHSKMRPRKVIAAEVRGVMEAIMKRSQR